MVADYGKGKIYQIKSGNSGKVYIGSTVQSLKTRFGNHQRDYKCYRTTGKTHYKKSYEVLKDGNCKIKLIEAYPCDNKKQLRAREKFYIRNRKCINKS